METMEKGRDAKGIGGVGPIVKVSWNDAAQNIKVHCIDGNEPENHLAKCETIGELISQSKKALILVQHWSDTDGIDIMAIPQDWCQEIEVLKECITESSESQQESQGSTRQKKSKK